MMHPLWMDELADYVEYRIKDANHAAWPITQRQLASVAGVFGKHLEISDEVPLTGILAGDLILVTTRRAAVHEIAHAILDREDVPPIATPGDCLIPHRIACVVDQRYARFMQFIEAAEQDAAARRMAIERRRNEPLPELTYVADENQDPPFESPRRPTTRRRRSRP